MINPMINPMNPTVRPNPQSVGPARHEPGFWGGGGKESGPIGAPIQHIPFFHQGTDYVEHTGPAILEKGEAVIPKEQNMNSVKEALGGHEPIKAKKRIKRIIHTKSHNGKHIITHEHHMPHHGEEHNEVHSLDNMSDVHDHLEAHAGTPNEGEQESQAGPQLTPSPAGQEGTMGAMAA